MRVDFYHLTATPLERALPGIVERVLAQGERMVIVAEGEVERISLDRLLWSYEATSFLPHAQAGGEQDARQPVLIAAEPRAANGARIVALVDGRWRDEALDFDRALHFFDDASITAARAAWRALKGHDGLELHYWKRDDDGRWQDMAQVANPNRAD